MFAWLQERRREYQDKPPHSQLLLALGDPVPPPPEQTDPPASKSPDHGLLVRVVQPGSNAANSGIQPGDVVLSYAGSKLSTRDELQKQIQTAALKVAGIAITVWRRERRLT